MKHECKYEKLIGEMHATQKITSSDVAEIKSDVKLLLAEKNKGDGKRSVVSVIIAIVTSSLTTFGLSKLLK